MPVATVDPNEYQRFDLKSAPPDGFVMARALPFGMKQERRDKAMQMTMEQRTEKRGKNRRRVVEDDVQTINLKTLSEWSTQFDFAYCIGEHNLTDQNGHPLDFTNPMTFKILNPKIGSEIEQILLELNEDEDEESLEDFIKLSTSSSETETIK